MESLLSLGRRSLPVVEEEPLPTFYSRWLREILPGAIPREKRATCSACAMSPTADPPHPSTPGHAFHSLAKCCTYQPDLPNFLVGAILSDQTSVTKFGQQSILARVEQGTGVTPLYLHKTPIYSSLYGASHKSTFGKAVALRCSHYLEETGGCGIWRYREAVCSTWFCKHERGAIGSSFWNALKAFLSAVESQLTIRCAVAAGATPSMLRASLKTRSADAGDSIANELVVDQYEEWARVQWETWRTKEVEFFLRCFEAAKDLSWADIRAVGGEEVHAREAILLATYAELVNAETPEHLKLAANSATRINADWYQATTYSNHNPLAIPTVVWESLLTFDGRSTQQVLSDLPNAAATLLRQDDLLQQLVDYGVLKRV